MVNKTNLLRLCVVFLLMGIMSIGLGAKGCVWSREGEKDNDVTSGSSVPAEPEIPAEEADVNHDGQIDTTDLELVAEAVDTAEGDPEWIPDYDIDGNGTVDQEDLSFVAEHLETATQENIPDPATGRTHPGESHTVYSTAPGYGISIADDQYFEYISNVEWDVEWWGMEGQISIRVDVRITTGEPADYGEGEFVNVWIDFNADKVFQPDEQILDQLRYAEEVGYKGILTCKATAMIPRDAFRSTWLRVELGYGHDPLPVDHWVYGDVEDYEVRLAPAVYSSDLNADGMVNIGDIATAGQSFGSYEGHPRWSLPVDQNGDGRVDIIDLVKIAKNFGKTLVAVRITKVPIVCEGQTTTYEAEGKPPGGTYTWWASNGDIYDGAKPLFRGKTASHGVVSVVYKYNEKEAHDEVENLVCKVTFDKTELRPGVPEVRAETVKVTIVPDDVTTTFRVWNFERATVTPESGKGEVLLTVKGKNLSTADRDATLEALIDNHICESIPVTVVEPHDYSSPLPLTEPLVDNTPEAITNPKWAFWRVEWSVENSITIKDKFGVPLRLNWNEPPLTIKLFSVVDGEENLQWGKDIENGTITEIISETYDAENEAEAKAIESNEKKISWPPLSQTLKVVAILDDGTLKKLNELNERVRTLEENVFKITNSH